MNIFYLSSVCFTFALIFTIDNALGEKQIDTNSIKDVVISIKPSDFIKLLKSESPVLITTSDERKNDKETIISLVSKIFQAFGSRKEETHRTELETVINTFRRFLMIFDFKNESDSSYLQLKRILHATAEHNKMISRNNTDSPHFLEIWLSIIPQGKITKQLELVTSLIQETNLVFDDTVPVFMLHYRSQRVGPQTLPVINQDIQITEEILKNRPNLSFGLILDGRNCYGSEEHFAQLNLAPTNIVVFMSVYSFEENIQLSHTSFTQCFIRLTKATMLRLHKKTPAYGYRLPMIAQLSFENLTFSFSRPKLEKAMLVPRLMKYASYIPIMEIKSIDQDNDNNIVDPDLVSVETQEKWLRRDSDIDKRFTGIVVYNEYSRIDTDSIIEPIWRTFCKVILQQRQSLHGPNITEGFQLFTEKLLNFRQASNKAGNSYKFCDKAISEVMVAVNVYQDKNNKKQFQDVNKALISNITGLTKTILLKHSNISLTLLLNWNSCLGIERCEDKSENNKEHYHHYSRHNNENLKILTSLAKYARAIQFPRLKPHVGIMLDWEFCYNFYMTGIDLLVNERLKAVDTYVFKIFVPVQKITVDGALKTSTKLIAKLQVCSSFVEGFTVASTQSVDELPPRSAYSVIIYGCNANSSDLNELTEVARFMELISQWGVSVDTTVFIGAAVEHAGGYTKPQNCTLKNASDSIESCDCGWWRASSPNTNVIIHEDKKSIALRLFENIHLPSSTEKSGDQSIKDESDILLKVLIPTSIFAAFLVGISLAIIIQFRLKHRLSNEEADRFFRGRHSNRNENGDPSKETYDEAENKPYNRKRYELSKSEFKIYPEKRLGGGEFGSVFCGSINRNGQEVDVAVKRVNKLGDGRSHGDFLALRALISEIKILSYVGEHRHIVQLKGAYTAKLKSGKLTMFLELCNLGSLLSFLRNTETARQPRAMAESQLDEDQQQVTPFCNGGDELSEELSQNLRRWSQEICSGMEFLSSKNMIHGDLAARNVLLTSNKCVKICDFGLSRRLYDDPEYIKSVAGPLPWKWMAPESLRRMIFNEKTDVWAFGVTLWEIFALGDEPYPGLSFEVNFPELLHRGLRLEKPRYSEKELYSVMKDCWDTDPDNRPTFSELRTILTEFVANQYVAIN